MRTSLLTAAVALGMATALGTPALGAVLGDDAATTATPRAFLAAAPAAAAAPVAEAPGAAVVFNDPTGDRAAQDRIADHVRRAIDATPAHGTIRMAAYSFDRPDIAAALARACTQRRVTVQVVLNDNFVSPSATCGGSWARTSARAAAPATRAARPGRAPPPAS